MRVPREQAELTEALGEQIDFLQESARRYDMGRSGESKRLALTLRILLNDTGRNSKSLLGQLGIKDHLWFVDTAGEINAENLLPTMGMLFIESTPQGATYRPNLGDHPRIPFAPIEAQVQALYQGRKLPRPPGFHLRFDQWWEEPVVKDAEGNSFSRKTLVHALADTDGGGHIDPGLDPAYHALSRLNSLGWEYGRSDGPEEEPHDATAFGSPVPAAVRGIAWEVLHTLDNQRPEIMKLIKL